MDVWEYFATKQREIEECSGALDEGFQMAAQSVEGQRGRVWGRVLLNERAFLQVSERVRVRGSGVTRDEYAYYLIVDGAEFWGMERDPTHDPVDHSHDSDHNRAPCSPISLKGALERAWDTLSAEGIS